MADENHFRGLSDKDQQYLHAAAWCKQEGKGAKAAIKTGKWPLISYATLQRRLNTGPLIQDKRALLTKDEEAAFALWIAAKAKANQGQNYKQQEAKVLEILELRRHVNKKGGRQVIGLSVAATNALKKRCVSREV